MKFRLIALLAVILVLSACKNRENTNQDESFKNALSYNDYIVKRQLAMRDMAIKVAQLSKSDLSKAEQTIDSSLLVMTQNIKEVESMPAWKNSTAFRDTAVRLFRFYQKTFAEDYKQIIAIQKDGQLNENESANYKEIVDRIDSIQTGLDAGLIKVQQQFAITNKFEPFPIIKIDSADSANKK